MDKKYLKIHPSDNVWVALDDLAMNTEINAPDKTFSLPESIPAKHKFASKKFRKGDDIIMYGCKVGRTQKTIAQGGLLTLENVSHDTDRPQERIPHLNWNAPDVSKFADRTFQGYHRADGQVGTANYWVVIPLVFCENRNVTVMKEAFLEELGFSDPNKYKNYVKHLAKNYEQGGKLHEPFEFAEIKTNRSRVFEHVDGIKFLTHQGGCGGTRQDAEMLCSLIAGYLNNPNVAGGTILSLGCQNAQVSLLQKKINALNPRFDKPLYILEQQQEGRENDLLGKAIYQTFQGLAYADKARRKSAPLSKLTIGLECGGSDGFSGISANPTVGQVADMVALLGGKTLLAEFPELCGVEQNLINRCTKNTAADKFMHLMQSYATATERVGSGFDMNPSPGNIKDGLITDAMKSAGAAKKGGNSPVTAVLDYAEYAEEPGLNLLCTPGNDVESTTALAGSGANIILFTTGLGTPTGNPIAPVIKISSNTDLARRMPDIIDFDAGAIITGKRTIPEMGEELLEYIISVASGTVKTKAHLLNQDDFIPWKRGISL